MPPGVPFDLRVMRLHSTDTLRGGFCTSDLRPPAGEPGVADGRPQCRPRERGCRRQHPLPRCAGARLGGAAHRHFPHPDVRGTRLFPVAPSPHHARRSGSTCLFKLSQVTGAHRAMAVWARRHTFCAGSPHRCGLQRHRHPGSRGRGRGRCRRDPAQQLYCQPFDCRRACWSRCFWPPTDRRRRLQTRSLWVIRRLRDRKHLPGPARCGRSSTSSQKPCRTTHCCTLRCGPASRTVLKISHQAPCAGGRSATTASRTGRRGQEPTDTRSTQSGRQARGRVRINRSDLAR